MTQYFETQVRHGDENEKPNNTVASNYHHHDAALPGQYFKQNGGLERARQRLRSEQCLVWRYCMLQQPCRTAAVIIKVLANLHEGEPLALASPNEI